VTTPVTWLLVVVGALLALLTLRDIFHTLWHPRGLGAFARLVFVVLWKVFRRLRVGSSLELAGPVSLMVTAAAWTAGLVTGFALIYLPFMPEAFGVSSQARPLTSDLTSSLYVSFVALVTLGFGDITPSQGWLQILAPFEALLGFVLLTAAISWVLQLYPALVHRRALARRLSSMAAAGTADMLPGAEASVAVQLLEDVRAELATAEMDLAQYAESYYFFEKEPDLSLAAQVQYVPRLIEAAEQSTATEVRHAGRMLAHGLERFTDLLAREFFRGRAAQRTDPAHVLPTYAADHDWG
jgi:hypothetical protein